MKQMILIVLVLCGSLLYANDYYESLGEAGGLAGAGKLEEAIEILEKMEKAYPDSAEVFAMSGMFLTNRAGQVNMMKAGMLSNKAFKKFSRALELEPEHRDAHLYRGILGVNVPKFMGKLKQGIEDLHFINQRYGAVRELYAVSSYFLGMGYEKAGEPEKAYKYYEVVFLYGVGSGYYDAAKAKMEELKTSKIDDSKDYYALAMEDYEKGDMLKALDNFRLAAKSDTTNLMLHMTYARTLGNLAEQGYDDSIMDDVTLRAGYAHEVHEVLSHCVRLAPSDESIRMLRANVAISLPFFVNSLDTGISDLEWLKENSKSKDVVKDATSLLKGALEMKKVYEMAEKGFEAGDEERMAMLDKFIPAQGAINQTQPEGESLKVELTLGYRDQIAPQISVWIEDKDGNYIETLYVSAFAANVKEKQVHLPTWAEKSKFKDLELVTGASIDCGKHTFYWEFDKSEKKQKEYFVCAEMLHWPHVQYKHVRLPVNLKSKKNCSLDERDFLISELNAKVVKK